MTILGQDTRCDSCGKKGTYQDVGRGSVTIFDADIKPIVALHEVCTACAKKAAKAVEEALKINKVE